MIQWPWGFQGRTTDYLGFCTALEFVQRANVGQMSAHLALIQG